MTRGRVVKLIDRALLLAALSLLSVGCATQYGLNATEKVNVPPSYLADEVSRDSSPKIESREDGINEDDAGRSLTRPDKSKSLVINPLQWQAKKINTTPPPADMFSPDALLSVSAEKMPVQDFIHYIFGELFSVNYVLGDVAGEVVSPAEDQITLNIANPISARDLFRLVAEVLIERQVQIKFGNETFFFYRQGDLANTPQLVIGIGRTPSEVPETAKKILQVVPLKFGIKVSIERTLRSLTNAKITPDFEQSAIYIEGQRKEIIRALELIDMLDTPAMRGRHIGLIEFSFIDPSFFSKEVLSLLENEGIDAAVGRPNNKNLVLVPLQQLGALAVFATNEFLLERVRHWAQLIDVPGEGPNKQYFLYHPKYARAIDLEDSVSALLQLSVSSGTSGVDQSGGSTGNAPSERRVATSNEISIVVDERSNALVLYTTGQRYKALLPLLRKLDVLPKQVMLDITVAEVSMKDEFKHGVEWALSRGEVNVTTQGAFGAASVGGIGLIIDGNEGPFTANFLTTNSLVNILSQPTLMVRDGVTARIQVGSQISVVGATTQDPINGERQTTSSEYRDTGISLTVTPTVNAVGIVVLEVDQTISNSVPGSSGAGGNPDIFERAIKTEVVARSGQTVLLGGLISENSASGGSGAPGLSKLPLLGNLFKARSIGSDRTELIMLITPRVLEDLSNWEQLIYGFKDGMKYLGAEREP